MSRPFTRRGDRIRLGLDDDERAVLRSVLEQFRDLVMADDDPMLIRLKPPARPDDPEADAAYREMVDDDLLRGRLEAIELVDADLADAEDIDDDHIAPWMQTINGLRLVLGERLDITEEDHDIDIDDPDAPLLSLYFFLGIILERLVRAAHPTL